MGYPTNYPEPGGLQGTSILPSLTVQWLTKLSWAVLLISGSAGGLLWGCSRMVAGAGAIWRLNSGTGMAGPVFPSRDSQGFSSFQSLHIPSLSKLPHSSSGPPKPKEASRPPRLRADTVLLPVPTAGYSVIVSPASKGNTPPPDGKSDKEFVALINAYGVPTVVQCNRQDL